MLTAELNKLLDTLDAADFDPPHDLAAALDALPPVGTLPAPHDTWTLLALAHYRAEALGVRAVHTLLAPTWARDHGGQAPGGRDRPGHPPRSARVGGRARRQRLLPGPPRDRRADPRRPAERPRAVLAAGRFVQYLLEHRQPGPGRAARARTPPGVRGPAPDAGRPDGRRRAPRGRRGRVRPVRAGLGPGRVHRRVPGPLGGPAAGRPRLARRRWSATGRPPTTRPGPSAIPALVDRTGRRAEACRRRRLDALRATEEIAGFRTGLLHALADAGAQDLSAPPGGGPATAVRRRGRGAGS